MWKSQTFKKNWSILKALVSCHFLSYLYLTKQCHFVKYFVLLLMSLSWNFQRHLNSNTQWSDRHLSSPDIPEAMISCGWFGTGRLIRYSLLLWPPVEVTSRVFADYICLFILRQIWILKIHHSPICIREKATSVMQILGRRTAIFFFLVTISQIYCKINSNTWANIISSSRKCRILISSSLSKILKSDLT